MICVEKNQSTKKKKKATNSIVMATTSTKIRLPRVEEEENVEEGVAASFTSMIPSRLVNNPRSRTNRYHAHQESIPTGND